MKHIVFGSYAYWHDGICWTDFTERADSEMEAIIETVERFIRHNEAYNIEEVIGCADQAAFTKKVDQVVDFLRNESSRKEEIDKLQRWLKHSEEWLATVESETARHLDNVSKYKVRLKELEE
jgi:hypothetical protein